MGRLTMAIILFFVLASLTLGGIVGLIVSRDQANGALFLVLSFASLGGLFALLDAPFVAVIQILIYAGAIMVLFIFIVMMVRRNESLAAERRKRIVGLALALSVVLAAELAFAVMDFASRPNGPPASAGPSPKEIGRLLFTTYLYPFEITSILILAALVGAIVLAKKDASA
jgi:NADH-quinone oxidoreductase subunit J